MALISSKPLGTLIRVADSDGGNGAANYEIADINNLVPGGVVLVRKNIHSESAFGSSTAYPDDTLDNKMTSIYNSLPEKLQSKGRVYDFALELFGQAVVNRCHFVVKGAAGVGGRAAEVRIAVDIFSHQHHAAGNEVVYIRYFVIGRAVAAVTVRHPY